MSENSFFQEFLGNLPYIGNLILYNCFSVPTTEEQFFEIMSKKDYDSLTIGLKEKTGFFNSDTSESYAIFPIMTSNELYLELFDRKKTDILPLNGSDRLAMVERRKKTANEKLEGLSTRCSLANYEVKILTDIIGEN
ncbi:hypothetical protein HOK68_00985 [Candidatus Woesearchaeota archaeon]|jgi:hypothetical protein|nr:hypothetical protein [Candidatus Woesearchaeota archaeon]MBT4387697.1 hypothetical protein [Candidatus Woesearchaeota archaeon]MBT4595941.1 hypothetical protein [Candidatus Woesearchaeota archaeon]MBT5741071.1 hypothetical protein [Candidatus Woesearchaeota archaeon]MBT6505335.1 hypothetical protein [Candidatus Woesearchaeota archaeon]